MLLIITPIIIGLALWSLPVPKAKANGACRQARAECSINNTEKACCEGLTCVEFNAHSGNGKCASNNHYICSGNACIQTSEVGYDECTVNADCETPPPQNHYICSDMKCIETNGAGTDECAIDADCETPPTETPTATPTPQQPPNQGGPGDGLSDGRSDGRSSCPECTKPPTGQVLGATTEFAGTGVAEDAIMNVVGALGGLSTAAGLILKKRSN